MRDMRDRRSYTRYQVDWRVRISSSARKTVGVGRIRDVSLGGALLEANLLYKDRERLELEIFPVYRSKLRQLNASVHVVHHRDAKRGGYIFGLEFLLIPDRDRKLLLNIISVQSGCQPIFDDAELGLEDIG
jgi:c-di-GMP-binding flagellar brake protein YcgR